MTSKTVARLLAVGMAMMAGGAVMFIFVGAFHLAGAELDTMGDSIIYAALICLTGGLVFMSGMIADALRNPGR